MQDVLNPVVGAYVVDTVTGWVLANAGITAGSLLVAVTALLWWRCRQR